MTGADRWACEHWCRTVNVENPGPCDCRMAEVRALVAERDQLRALDPRRILTTRGWATWCNTCDQPEGS